MKKKNSYSTYLLLGAFAALTAWYVLYEKKIKVEQAGKADKDLILVPFERDQIQEIEITQRAQEKTPASVIKLKKTGSNWTITAPIEDAADEGTVGSMLTTLTTTKEERVVEEEPKDVKTYGLEDPVFKIKVSKDANHSQEIWVGDNTQVGFSVYAKKGDAKRVLKVNRTLQTTFDKTLYDIRNKSLVTFPKIDVSEAEITGPKGNLIVRTEDKNKWTLARENMPADSNEWSKVLSAITDLRAVSVPAEKATNLAAYGLTKPFLNINLTTSKDKPRLNLLIGKVGDKVYAKRDDKAVVYEVDKAFLEKANKSGSELRDLHLANFNRFDVQHIRMEWHDNAVIDLKKVDGGKWELADAKPDEKVDAAQVDRLLTRFLDTKVVRYLDPKTAQEQLMRRITIQLFEKKDGVEKKVTELHLGRLIKGEVFGTREGLPLAFALKDTDFDLINVTRKSLLEKAEPAEQKAAAEPKSSS